ALLHAETPQPITERYRETAGRLIGAALSDPTGYQKLTYLCDRFGNRITGSTNLQQAIAWAAEQMRKDGLVHVSTPLVKVQPWVRGHEKLLALAPFARDLPMLGLGGSVGTPASGIEAEVVPV